MRVPAEILMPTDFSDPAAAALAYAVPLAGKLHARIHLLHVIGVPDLGFPELGIAVTSPMIEKLVMKSQASLDLLVDQYRGQASFAATVQRTGDPRDMILQAAKEIGADLIILATHGRRGISRALFGSVTESIVRAAPCPVLTFGLHWPRQAGRRARAPAHTANPGGGTR